MKGMPDFVLMTVDMLTSLATDTWEVLVVLLFLTLLSHIVFGTWGRKLMRMLRRWLRALCCFRCNRPEVYCVSGDGCAKRLSNCKLKKKKKKKRRDKGWGFWDDETSSSNSLSSSSSSSFVLSSCSSSSSPSSCTDAVSSESCI